MIDRSWIGKSFAKLMVDVEKGQLLLFAKAVGEKSPVYTDEKAAKAAGFRSLPAPPTFTLSLGLASPDPFEKYSLMGINLIHVLHGSQKFEYIAPICAGDTIILESTVTDIYERKSGALEFLVEKTVATNQAGEVVAKLYSTLVIRN